MAARKRAVVENYDVAEHVRNAEEIAAYLEACIPEANGDAALIAKALDDVARALVGLDSS